MNSVLITKQPHLPQFDKLPVMSIHVCIVFIYPQNSFSPNAALFVAEWPNICIASRPWLLDHLMFTLHGQLRCVSLALHCTNPGIWLTMARKLLIVLQGIFLLLNLDIDRIQFSVRQRSVQVKSFVQFWMHPFGIRVFFVCIRECNALH